MWSVGMMETWVDEAKQETQTNIYSKMKKRSKRRILNNRRKKARQEKEKALKKEKMVILERKLKMNEKQRR